MEDSGGWEVGVVWLNDLLKLEGERGERAGTTGCRDGWTDGDQQDTDCPVRRVLARVLRGKY